MSKKIYIPTKDMQDWKQLLVKDEHWEEGRSAMSTAYSWEKRKDIPTKIKNVLSQNNKFKGAELLLAIPEFVAPLKGSGGSSQNDVLAVFTNSGGLSVMTVEGKVDEGFDKTVAKWRTEHEKESRIENRNKRLIHILKKIGLKDEGIENLRYQLFHRLASAVIMAEKFHAKNAIMIVQSFEDDDSKNNFSDFVDFLYMYNIENVEKERLYKLTNSNGIEVFAGWVYTRK